MDRLESMKVLMHVAELGSFAAAARELRLSPTMIAKHVADIEQRLGAQVIRRTTRRHSITEVGQLYISRARAVLADVETAEASARELQAAARGTLRVTAPVVLGAHALAPLLGELLANHPELSVELSLQDRVVDLIDEGYDVALRSGPLAPSGLIARPLAPLRMLLAAAPAYLRVHGAPRRPRDLERHQCLGFSYLVHLDRWRLVGADGEHAVRVASRLQINSGEALREAALGGAGIVMQSELLLARDLVAGGLVRVLPGYAPPPRSAHVVYHPDRWRAPKLQRFVELVLERLGPPRVRRVRRSSAPARHR
jgi:DNA-binding transcriptional LysR family regulator